MVKKEVFIYIFLYINWIRLIINEFRIEEMMNIFYFLIFKIKFYKNYSN